jgi:hypothetical protein
LAKNAYKIQLYLVNTENFTLSYFIFFFIKKFPPFSCIFSSEKMHENPFGSLGAFFI